MRVFSLTKNFHNADASAYLYAYNSFRYFLISLKYNVTLFGGGETTAHKPNDTSSSSDGDGELVGFDYSPVDCSTKYVVSERKSFARLYAKFAF